MGPWRGDNDSGSSVELLKPLSVVNQRLTHMSLLRLPYVMFPHFVVDTLSGLISLVFFICILLVALEAS